MQIQQPERILREMIAEAKAAEAAETSRDSLINGLFPRTEWPAPPRAKFPRLGKKADRRSDFVILL